MSTTIGADPELFIRSIETGAVHPIVGLMGGTKACPRPMSGLDDGYAVQEDNVMAEFNIPPASNPNMFASYIEQGMAWIHDALPTGYEVDFNSSRVFGMEQLESAQAATFGCSAEYDAYNGGSKAESVQRSRLATADGTGEWRFAGGHIHIGYDNPSEVPDYVVAQLCDVFIGLLAADSDSQGLRRTLYGQAGRFRPTPYGIEYRTLSNFWVFDSYLANVMGQMALRVGQLVSQKADEVQAAYGEIPWLDVQAAINNEDAAASADLRHFINNDINLETSL